MWMNARNDLIAGQIPDLIEEHATEIYFGGEAKEAPGPEKELRGKPGDKNFYSMFMGRLRTDEEGKNYGTDDEDVDAAIACIKNHPQNQPLCLFLGLQNPHPPYQVEEPYYSAIDRKLLKERIRAEKGNGKPKMEELIRKNQNMQDYTEDDWDEMRACYLGMCMKVDVLFKKICDALKDAGEYDNSVIFFFSDHGDYTGDYGISEKAQNTFEDCLTNVPLLIKPPVSDKVDAGITDSMAELIDFYATALDYAEVVPKHSHFGYSLRSVLTNRQTKNREYVCCEGGRLKNEIHCDEFHVSGADGTHPYHLYWPRQAAQADAEAHAKGYMLRTETWKYVARVNGADELYDLRQDPQELNNLVDIPEYQTKRMEYEQKLLRWLMATADVVPYDYDMRFSEKMTWAKVKKHVPQEHEEEIRKKIKAGVPPFLLIEECKKRFG